MLRYCLLLISCGVCTAYLTSPDQSIPSYPQRPIKDDPIADLWNDRKVDYKDVDISKFNGSLTRTGDTYRLSNDTRPEGYDITLETRVDLNDFAFTGHVLIDILIVTATRSITLHHRQLTIGNIQLFTSGDNREVEVSSSSYNTTYEELTILTDEQLYQDNRYRLQISYNGTLRSDRGGFYRTSYISESGEPKYLAATQFESTNARHGFPCYDEPGLRARFTLRIIHGAGYSAVSNMPVWSVRENPNGTVTTQFMTLPDMQTYLLAFVVSDFPYYQSNDDPLAYITGVTPQRVYARPTAIQSAHLALDAGRIILNEIAKYVDVIFTLPKMDQFSIPGIGGGAMENWGLVTYGETRFLFDPTVDTYILKQSIVSVIAHEFGHQWFGNLVGPQWWTYIWLNEGFATLFGYYGPHLAYPEWRYLDRFATDLQSVLVYDASPLVRPMSFYRETPSDISGLFDGIAYDKSGCVIRMFLHAFVESTFRKGLNYYIIEKQYTSATEDDLFDALELAVKEDQTLPSDYNVKDIFSSWTQQGGFPLLTVTRDYSTNTTTISQQRYLDNSTADPGLRSWWIPYNFATASRPDFTSTAPDRWLPRSVNNQSFGASSFGDIGPAEWIVFNKQQAYYYRVLYDTENYRLIAEELYSGNLDNIHYLSRANIIDDAFTFAANDRITYNAVLDIIKYMQYEPEYAPFVPLTNHLTTIHRMLSGSEKYDILKQFIARLFETLFERVGIEDLTNESLVDKYARTLVINWACYAGNENCLNAATKRIEEFARTGRDIGPNVKSVLYCSGLRNASLYEFQFIWDELFSAPVGSSIRATYLNALACTTNSAFLREFLESSIQLAYPYTTQERDNVFNAVFQSGPEGLRMSLNFALDNIERIESFFTPTALRSSLGTIAQRIVNEDLQELYTRFKALLLLRNHATNDDVVTPDATIANNFVWLGKYQETIETFVENHLSGGSHSALLSTTIIILATILSFVRLFYS